MSNFTKGPWNWVVNKTNKRVDLHSPNHEVMRFERYGMQSAQPTFLSACKRFQGEKAVDQAVVVEGREHHADWFMGIDHPDAHLISAAPDMYEALDMVLRAQALIISANVSPENEGEMQALSKMINRVEAALAKADGKA